eukprot:405985_1
MWIIGFVCYCAAVVRAMSQIKEVSQALNESWTQLYEIIPWHLQFTQHIITSNSFDIEQLPSLNHSQLEKYAWCHLLNLLSYDELTTQAEAAWAPPHVQSVKTVFWEQIAIIRFDSPRFKNISETLNGLILGKKWKDCFAEASEIGKMLKLILDRLPATQFPNLHRSINLLWRRMRIALLDQFYSKLNTTNIDGISLDYCRREFELESQWIRPPTSAADYQILQDTINPLLQESNSTSNFNLIGHLYVVLLSRLKHWLNEMVCLMKQNNN